MSRLERLLAATDLSAPARHPAERAALVAKDAGATLRLLHVVSDPATDAVRRRAPKRRGAGARNRTRALMRHVNWPAR